MGLVNANSNSFDDDSGSLVVNSRKEGRIMALISGQRSMKMQV